ncbi:MAG TPA: hypothetical protein VJB96_01550 [Patescibacteria group bacterium]|nr:hypothetical protein [Patescibacteria group bacterium]
MKIQDILFFAVFAVLFFARKPRLFVWFGLGCLVLAIPLFATWTFFTAERLTWYAAACFLTFLVISLAKPGRVK